MKRAIGKLSWLLLLFPIAACQGTNVPEQRDLLGSWISTGFAQGTIRMTLTETARAVEGAGSWVTTTSAEAFGVSGAVADDEVSLLLEFDGRADINFQGAFTDDDVIEGVLSGSGFQRTPIILDRQDLNE